MIVKIKNIIQSNKNVIANFSYLSILQILNLAIPIITYPYLIKTLGGEVYGQLVYAQALIGYTVILINFGFNITATKEISIHRNDYIKVNEIVNSIFQIKAILFIVSFSIVITCLLLMNLTKSNWHLYILTMWMSLYEFLFPVWYFQGTERMKYITILSGISRILFLIIIFYIVNSPSDYLNVPILNGIGALISCIASMYILRKNKVTFVLQNKATLLKYFKNSYVIALSFGINSFKTNFNIVIVKFLFSFTYVAYYDLAIKVINIATSFLDLISQAIYPRMSTQKDPKFLKVILKVSLLISTIAMILIQLFSSQIINILGGQTMMQSSILLIVLATVLPIYITGALLGRNCLIIFGYDIYVLKSMLYSSIIYVALILIFRSLFKTTITGIAIAYVLSFLSETAYRFGKCKKLNLLNNKYHAKI